MSKNQTKEMSFFEHLEELRWHILRSLLVVTLAGIVLFIFQDWIFKQVIFGPTQKDFFSYQFICKLSHAVGLGDNMCFSPPEFKKQAIGFGEAFAFVFPVVCNKCRLQTALKPMCIAVIGTSPVILRDNANGPRGDGLVP